ncbi:MAG: alpha/beta fold hydrolase [Flavobacteriaceae bacterium]|nr:alpha/beta fold hydrolase [Flavobacteriaceae bacterium]
MKSHLLFWFIAFISLQTNAQNPLQGKWKFTTGDNLLYAQPAFDDSGWKELEAGILWENQGFDGYDGFGWYRFKATIPSSLKANAAKYGGLILDLQKIDDSDETFLNGVLIGKHGAMPPNYVSAYDEDRRYAIPIDKILWDQENTIAVRVYDLTGGGGIYNGPVSLQSVGLSDQLKISVDYVTSDHIVRSGNSISLTVVIKNNSDENLEGTLSAEIVSDFKEQVYSKKEPLVLRKRSGKKHTLSLTGLAPGFYTARIEFKTNLATIRSYTAFGIEPEHIQSPVDSQYDFENYWKRAKKELAAVDPQYKLTKIDSLSTPTRNTYLLEMRSLGNVLIRGWYNEPVKPGKYPALLHVQGYNTVMIPEWAYQSDDFAVLALNVRGHGNSRDNLAPSFNSMPSYLLTQLHDKEQYIYRGAYMDTRRAVDFLFSRPMVDTTKVVVEGGSQGGALSIATAALNNDRIRLCMPDVPFLSDFPHYFVVGNWPGNEFKAYQEMHPEMGWDKIYETLSYIDIKNLAPWVKAPVLMAVGLKDETCPPHINFAAYNQLQVQKEYVVYPEAGHSLPAPWRQIKYDWMRKQLGM